MGGGEDIASQAEVRCLPKGRTAGELPDASFYYFNNLDEGLHLGDARYQITSDYYKWGGCWYPLRAQLGMHSSYNEQNSPTLKNKAHNTVLKLTSPVLDQFYQESISSFVCRGPKFSSQTPC